MWEGGGGILIYKLFGYVAVKTMIFKLFSLGIEIRKLDQI